MKRMLMILIAAGALTACDKKPETTEPTAEAQAETTGAAAESAEEAPEAPAESAASDGEEKKAELADDIEPGATGFFGDRFTVIEPPITLASALDQADEYKGPVKVEAKVAKVCKKKGCWFTMSDDSTDTEIRVKMKDYGFFVPRNADGADVIAEGTLTSREIPQEEAQHYADDAAEEGEEPKKIDGPQKTWEFTATAVEVRAPKG